MERAGTYIHVVGLDDQVLDWNAPQAVDQFVFQALQPAAQFHGGVARLRLQVLRTEGVAAHRDDALEE